MRPGITIQHATQLARESRLVRSDVVGFIGFVTKQRWPKGAQRGDFVEMPLESAAQLLDSRAKALFDPVTVDAVSRFFQNGGSVCRAFSVCIESEQDLFTKDPFMDLFSGLMDRLREEEDIGLLALPVLAYLPVSYAGGVNVEVPWQPTLEMFLEHCMEMNYRFMLIDTPRELHGEALFRWVDRFRTENNHAASFGALYYPWLKDGDLEFPPSGCIAGMYARTDAEHAPFGVRWPPANQVLRAVTHPAHELRWRDSDEYINAHINLVLVQPARGVIVWGARTLSREPRWTHINSRRIVSYITEQIRRDSEWVVFENQRPELWEIIRRMVGSRLDMMWSAGLLTGDQARSEYEVLCDAELNPPEVRDAGQVNVKVLLRPISTAEFIVVDLKLG